MTEDSTLGLPMQADSPGQASPPETQLVARIFLVALGALLVGYMFLGRGFAHVGIGPVYVGDMVLFLGVATTAVVLVRAPIRPRVMLTIALLLAFVALGAVRTLPYLGLYRLDALRDGVLWGYAAFAVIVYLLVDRAFLLRAFRLYGWVVPIFALWLPISWNLFARASAGIDGSNPGSFVPLVFFKGGDMAVHTVGAIAFLVIGASSIRSARTLVWRTLISLPLLWTVFVAGTSNRGALLTAAVGILAVALLAPRWRSWLPLLSATAVFAIALVLQGVLAAPVGSATTGPTPIASESETPSPSGDGASLPSGRSGAPVSTTSPHSQYSGIVGVANPDFEFGALSNGTIERWTHGNAGSYNIVAGEALQGARFASIQNVLKGYQATLTSSRVPFEGGEDIAVSAWVKAVSARPILEIYVNWYDGSGTLISSAFLKRLDTHGVMTWQECVGFLPAPANATQAEIMFYEASGKATIGLDDVTLKSGSFIPEPVPPKGRPATLRQMIENLVSVFGPSSEGGLEWTKQFRLAWWGKIVDYTLFGKYFWTGKGFGVNLADSDGFQATADHSLRSPHNSNVTVLARMGVPGFLIWVLFQAAFGFGLLRAVLAHRRAGDRQLAAVGGLVFAYWVAMMVDTSFDPYLEGPQGGIWFWVIVGLGLVVMRLAPRRGVAA